MWFGACQAFPQTWQSILEDKNISSMFNHLLECYQLCGNAPQAIHSPTLTPTPMHLRVISSRSWAAEHGHQWIHDWPRTLPVTQHHCRCCDPWNGSLKCFTHRAAARGERRTINGTRTGGRTVDVRRPLGIILQTDDWDRSHRRDSFGRWLDAIAADGKAYA